MKYVVFDNNVCGFVENDRIYEALKKDYGEERFTMVIDLTVSGSNYQERKDDIRQKAIEFQRATYCANMSYGELFTWQELFRKWAKHYGLLNEFQNEGIC